MAVPHSTSSSLPILRIVNGKPGSGSRALLDRLLANAAIDGNQVQGYDREARGHLAAAYSVVSGDADVCLDTRSAAQTFGLAPQRLLCLGIAKKDGWPSCCSSLPRCFAAGRLGRKLEVFSAY